MKKILPLFIAVILGIIAYVSENGAEISEVLDSHNSAVSSEVYSAFQDKKSDVQVTGNGSVTKVLPDDLKGSRHQKFILKLPSGISVLIAHNIDLAPRIPTLKEGDEVAFFGEYEWNSKGGVVHWTHHDPNGKHLDGWLKHGGNRYQ